MPYFPNVLLLHLMPLDHCFSFEETAVFVIVESLLAEKMGLLFSLCVLQVLFMFGYSFLLLFLRRAVVLIHFLHAYRVKTKTSLRITVTQDLEDLQSLVATLPFSSQKDTKILTATPGTSRTRLVTFHARPYCLLSCIMTHQVEKEKVAIKHKHLRGLNSTAMKRQ